MSNLLLHSECKSSLLQTFLRTHHIDPTQSPTETLFAMVQAFARLPYENLTKIIKDAESGNVDDARRTPGEVLADHAAYGTGGTCFSLTATMLHLVRALGFAAEPILADRRYGVDTHCALLVWIDGEPRLLDPGYQIVRPLPIPTSGEVRVRMPLNELILTAKDGGARVDLDTVQGGQRKHRLTFNPAPVDAGEFVRAWDRSFDFDMMRYPVLSRVFNGKQIYLQKKHLLIRGQGESCRAELTPDRMVAEIAAQFQIAPSIVAKALQVLMKKGKRHG